MSGSSLVLSPDERAALRAVWRRMIPRDGSVWDVPFFRRSLLSLARQGYVLQDIGAMFGVSRERARQWFAAIGVRPKELRGGGRRLWDWKRQRFITVDYRSLIRHKTRPCACGCGRPTTKQWALGHNARGRRHSISTRQVFSRAAQKRWARTSRAERHRIGQKISLGWRQETRRAARKRMLDYWAKKHAAPKDEGPREHPINAIAVLQLDQSPEGVAAGIVRIERAIQLLDRKALREKATATRRLGYAEAD